MEVTAQTTTRMSVTRLATEAASFQAVARFPLVSKVVNVGMNAEASAPPATSV